VIQKRLQEGVREEVCCSTKAIVGDEHAHLLFWQQGKQRVEISGATGVDQ